MDSGWPRDAPAVSVLFVDADRVQKTLAELVARKARIDLARVNPGARLIDFGLDSVRALELIVDLELAFGLEIPDQDLASAQTVGDIARYLERRLA